METSSTAAAAPPAPRTKKRILCLHGRRTNEGVMKFQVSQLKRYLGKTPEFKDAEYVFVHGPHQGDVPADPVVGQMFAGPYFEWWDSRQGADGKYVYEGAEAALRHLVRVLRERGPFDALVGFSQGSIAAATITALRQAAGEASAGGVAGTAGGAGEEGGRSMTAAEVRIRADPVLVPMAALLPELRAVPRWPLVVLFSGLVPRASGWAAALWPADEPVGVASVHVVSKEDFVYASGLELVNVFAERRPAAVGTAAGGMAAAVAAAAAAEIHGNVWRSVVAHDQGHRFPTATAKISGSSSQLFYEVLRDAVVSAWRVATS